MDHIPIGKTPQDDPDNVVPFHAPASDDAAEEMSYEEAMEAELADDEGYEEAATNSIPGSGVAGLLEQGMRVGAGLFSAGATAFADALRTTMPQPPADERDRDDPASTLAGAGLGAAVIAAEAAAAAARDAADTVAPLVSWVINPRFAKDATEMAGGATRVLDGQWKAAQAETVEAASAFLSMLIPEITTALFDQIDLTKLVRDNVDVNAIVDDVDLDRIMDKVDVDAIVAKVDMERLAQDFPVDAIVDRLDVDGVVAKVDLDQVVDRVDVDRIIERVDLNAIVDRIDLGAVVTEVLDEVDLPAIVRESSGALAGESVAEIRLRGMDADRFVAKIVDRILMRRRPRDLELPRTDRDG